MYSKPKKRPKSSMDSRLSSDHFPSSSSTLTSVLSESPPPSLFPSQSEFFTLLAVISIAFFVAAGCNLLIGVYNRKPKPLCDSSVEFDNSVSNICEPCPMNGICSGGLLKCNQGYKKQGKFCIEDADINEASRQMSEWIQSRLCKVYGQLLCGGTGIIWVSEVELRNDLDSLWLVENSHLDSTTYKRLKERAIDNINSLLDSRTDAEGIKEFKCPEFRAEAYKPITCCVRFWIAKHYLILVSVCALVVASTSFFLRIHRKWYLSNRSEQLYRQVCDILEENALMSKNVNGGEPWVVASRLRDHLLSPRERRDPLLWKKVEEFVEEDTRVDRYPKLVKGDSKVVWEWQVEGSLSSSGKIKKGDIGNLKPSSDHRSSNYQDRSSNIEPKMIF